MEKALESLQIHALAGWQSIHCHADHLGMGLPKDRDMDMLTEVRGHVYSLLTLENAPRNWVGLVYCTPHLR